LSPYRAMAVCVNPDGWSSKPAPVAEAEHISGLATGRCIGARVYLEAQKP
jgi:hypothetical protein